MAAKNLSYFMRENKPKTIKFDGPETFVDENGKRLEFEMRVLTMEEQEKINDMYTETKPAKDKKNNFIIQRGKLVYDEKKDSQRASRHMMAEALIYPDLKDKKLMEYYNCHDISEMPFKVFSDSEEFGYMNRKMLELFGYLDEEDDEEEDVDDAKN